MEINIGDKVRFLNDVGGGVVVKIISKTQVLIKDHDDFEYPFLKSELVVIEKAQTLPKPEKVQTLNQKPEIIVEKRKLGKGLPELKDDNISEILFAFIRKTDDSFDGFECFLINDSNFYLFYHVVLKGENGFEKIDAEVLEPNTKISVGTLDRTRINASKEIVVQILFYGHPYETLRDMIERRIKIVPLKFFQEHVFLQNDFFDEKAYIFELLKEQPGLGQSIKTDDDFERNLVLKDIETEEDKSKKYKPRKEAEVIEIDLHINELVESVIGMTNAEIIQKQLEVFHKTMTSAILNKAGKVILIHGIGNGTLKAALRESLSVQYKLTYEDASFREYGFGATLVIL